MKTAIITFQDAINYGAVLQAYALKTTLNKYSECDVINYYNDFFHRKSENKSIKSMIVCLLNKKNKKEKEKKFNRFLDNYIISSSNIYDDNNLKSLNDQYDLFVTGSDQVWNFKCSGNKKSYFLDFVDSRAKKASYAASFGSNQIENKEIVRKLLSDFLYISVRENSGREILNDIYGKEYPVVLDPTLLITKEEWKKQFDLSESEKYVLVYEVLNGQEILSLAKQYAEEHNFHLKYITSSNKPQVGVECIKNAGPEEWLDLISNSAFIFTNSFHGLAFSLIFNKQFAIELLPPPANTNARLIELLEKVGLENRIIKNSIIPEKLIDFSTVNTELKILRDQSIGYIKTMVGVKENEGKSK